MHATHLSFRAVPPACKASFGIAIEIEKVEGYIARVTPPHGREEWASPQPMSAEQSDRVLHDLGCHPTDVGDAFYEADPSCWLNQH